MRYVSGRTGCLVAWLLLGSGLVAAAEPAAAQDETCCRRAAVDTAGPASGQRLSLPEAVRIAIDRNRQIQTARFNLAEAEEQVSEAWGSVYPRVDLTASYVRNVSPAVNFVPARLFDDEAPADELVPLQFGADNTWQSTFALEQPLFDAAAFIGVGAAGRYQTLQEEVLRGRMQAVVTSVRSSYYDLLLAQEQARLLENSVRRVQQSLEDTRAMNRAGLVSDYDVLRLEVELANLEPNLLRARNAVRQARRELGVALQVEDVEGLEVEGALATMDLTDPAGNSPENRMILAFSGVEAGMELNPADVEHLVQIAVEERSDVRQMELTETLRHTEMRLEQVDYLPRVSLVGNYGINASQNGAPEFFGAPRAYSRTVGVQLSLPLFTGLQREARIDQRRAALRAAESETALARDRAESEVRTLLDQVEEARQRARGQRLAVEQATRGFEIAGAQFREGLGSQLELTDAEVALRESEFNYAEAVYDYLVARARLDEAAGRVPFTVGGAGVGPEAETGR